MSGPMITMPDGALKRQGDSLVPQGVLCRVSRNADQSITSGTSIKVQFNSELADPYALFDTSTNYRFQPTTTYAGYYRVAATVAHAANASTGNAVLSALYKNGSELIRFGQVHRSISSDMLITSGSEIVYFNGSTDYAEIFAYDGATAPVVKANYTVFSAELLGTSVGYIPARTMHCTLSSTVATSIPNANWTNINFDTIWEEDIPPGWTSAADLTNDRIYARNNGLYIATFAHYFATASAGRRISSINVTRASGGTITVARDDGHGPTGNNNPGTVLASRPIRLNAGDYVVAQAFQDSGAALNIATDVTGGSPLLSLTQIGP